MTNAKKSFGGRNFVFRVREINLNQSLKHIKGLGVPTVFTMKHCALFSLSILFIMGRLSRKPLIEPV